MEALIQRLKEFYASLPTEGEARLELPPVATLEQVEWAEQRIGFRLPELLRELYLEIGNGGCGNGIVIDGYGQWSGPGYSIEEAAQIYAEQRQLFQDSGTLENWNKQLARLFPFGDGGCGQVIMIDCRIDQNRVILSDTSGFVSENYIRLIAPSLRAWLEDLVENGHKYWADAMSLVSESENCDEF